MTVDRRRFLQLSALGVLASVAAPGCSSRSDRAADRPQLLSMLGPEKVRQLGMRYRAANPAENATDALRSAISRSTEFHIPLIKAARLDDQVRDDFAAGRTIVLDGWILSVTEARQCALYSLASA